VSRIDGLIEALHSFYGLLPSPPRDPFTLFVWDVLSPHSTPQKREAAMSALKRIPALTPDSMFRAPQKKLLQSVALAGPYAENRLSALRTGADLFRRNPDLPSIIRGPLVAARRSLNGLPQMGEGGAYRMLLFAADHPILPVDARVARTATRLGYGELHAEFPRTARSVREALAPELGGATETFRRTFLYLSQHGAATCTERDPHCAVCPLLFDCPEGQRRTSSRMRHDAGAL
jgi:endonuclease III